MEEAKIPELWQWSEFYCPWSYIAAVRLNRVRAEFEGRVRLRIRAFPLEIYGGGPPNRQELELEMWLAAQQEPEAPFKAFGGGDWPETTLPAFEAAWCAKQLGELAGRDFDLRIRRAFFSEGRNIGSRDVMFELADEAGLDRVQFTRLFASGKAREAVLAEGRMGKERYGVTCTPTLMRSDGTSLRLPIAYPDIQDMRIVSVERLPCCGEGCDEAVRDLFEQALQHAGERAN